MEIIVIVTLKVNGLTSLVEMLSITFKWAAALSLSVKTPVDSTT